MRKLTKENILGNLKNSLDKAMSDAGVYLKGGEGFHEATSFKNSLPTNEEKKKKKKKNKEGLVTTTKMNTPIMKVFSMSPVSEEMLEKWSEKYKKSIDCNNPKGFSQRAHCQGRKKKVESKEATGAGSAGTFTPQISFDEQPKKMETKEATTSASSGPYDASGFEDINMRGNHEKGSGNSFKKTQIRGGKFVEVKKKCKKFPYCNQGDINALKLWENETLKKVISKISKTHQISENVIKNIISYELKKIK